MRLTDEQQQTLRAAADRIIPPDDYPGAWQSGVGDYLARQFEGDLLSELDDYRSGLTALEAESIARFQQRFILLSHSQQDRLLKHIEAGEVLTVWAVAPPVFFNLLVNTTAEGFYSEPEQGGNRAGISWAMIGFADQM
jgi:Gluconate 2-dehydrogenase subunit 3